MRGCGRDSTSSGNSLGDRRDCRSAWPKGHLWWLCVCTPLLGRSWIWLIWWVLWGFENRGFLGLGFFVWGLIWGFFLCGDGGVINGCD